MITIWMTYFVAAVAASGVFIVAGWRSRKAFSTASVQDRSKMPNDPLWGESELNFSESSPQADAGGALRMALKRLTPVMGSQGVQAEVAAPFGLRVCMRGGALADLLEELLAAAIHGAPASRILLAAGTDGNYVYVSVTDDMPGVNADVRRAGVRGLKDRVAIWGGTLDVHVQPTEGTTMTLRLAAADSAPNPQDIVVPDHGILHPDVLRA